MAYVEYYGGGVSFAELRRRMPDFRSEDPPKGFAIGEWDRNVLIWLGMSRAASAAISELVEENKIYFKSTSLLVYFVDGLTLQLPLAKPGIRKYKSQRWLPVAIYPVTSNAMKQNRKTAGVAGTKSQKIGGSA